MQTYVFPYTCQVFLQQGSFIDARLFLKQNDWPFPNSCKRVPLYKPGVFLQQGSLIDA